MNYLFEAIRNMNQALYDVGAPYTQEEGVTVPLIAAVGDEVEALTGSELVAVHQILAWGNGLVAALESVLERVEERLDDERSVESDWIGGSHSTVDSAAPVAMDDRRDPHDGFVRDEIVAAVFPPESKMHVAARDLDRFPGLDGPPALSDDVAWAVRWAVRTERELG